MRLSRFPPKLALFILSTSFVIAPVVGAFNFEKRPCCAPAASACECPNENPCQAAMNVRVVLPEIAPSLEAKGKRSIDGPLRLPTFLAESAGLREPAFARADSMLRECSARHRLRRMTSLRI